jgi:dCMP deaminase
MVEGDGCRRDEPPRKDPMISRQEKWDRRFIDLARHISTWSKDPSTQVGAVIVDAENRVVSVGYNGFPRHVADTDMRLNDRELKYKIVVHAERNAMLFARQSLAGCTIYTWPFMSCAACTGMAIQAGIERHVAPINDNPRWAADFELSKQMFREAGIALDLLVVEPTSFCAIRSRNATRRS